LWSEVTGDLEVGEEALGGEKVIARWRGGSNPCQIKADLFVHALYDNIAMASTKTSTNYFIVHLAGKVQGKDEGN